jgi:hypothetical protein
MIAWVWIMMMIVHSSSTLSSFWWL